ncbi:DUF6916 family protein [Dokdonella sp.]|uniref:DUF6916 family protein n=1 Tax=Dokdonella sp. TaxID=2291710 RepID=UPI002F411A41
MSQPRRQFLRLFGAAATMLALGKSAFVAAAAAGSLGDMDASSFARMVGAKFQLERDGAPSSELDLVKVVPLQSVKGYPDARRARAGCFTLVFRTAQPSALPEGIYDFSNSGARFQAYMSPIRGDGLSYQVVFNRT